MLVAFFQIPFYCVFLFAYNIDLSLMMHVYCDTKRDNDEIYNGTCPSGVFGQKNMILYYVWVYEQQKKKRSI